MARGPGLFAPDLLYYAMVRRNPHQEVVYFGGAYSAYERMDAAWRPYGTVLRCHFTLSGFPLNRVRSSTPIATENSRHESCRSVNRLTVINAITPGDHLPEQKAIAKFRGCGLTNFVHNLRLWTWV